MCTAVTYQTQDHYFGRTLDLEYSHREAVTVTPRAFPLPFRRMQAPERRLAIIGMAYVAEGYPLYYDAVNEAGLAMAGLNFPGNAHYRPCMAEMDNVAPFELIPWVLCQCADLSQARALLERLNLADLPFSRALPLTPLHWLLSHRGESLTLEPARDGLQLYPNPVGVLTNSPPFPFHMTNLCNYMGLSSEGPENRFSQALELAPYSRGMGALGLPGDLSSSSRFVRAAFTKLNAVSGPSEEESVSQFFHILAAVEQTRGCVRLEDGRHVITVYTSCCNADRGIYYYTTYENRQISAVDLHREDLDSCRLSSYPLLQTQQIRIQNETPSARQA